MARFLEVEIDDETNEYHIEGELGYDEVIEAKSFPEVLENETKKYSEYTEEYQQTLGYKDGLKKAEELYILYQKINGNKMNQSISENSQVYINKLERALINAQKENEKIQNLLNKNGINLEDEFSR